MSKNIPRFLLYIKAASNGTGIGDCPFCQRVMIYANLRVPPEKVEVRPVDTYNKPEDFLKINPDGKVPVLIDREANDKIVTDSAEINKYFDEQFPDPVCKPMECNAANEACQGVFGKVAGLIKNKDDSKTDELKHAVTDELQKVESYLQTKEEKGRFLLGDKMTEVDCMILPRLRHLAVAGKHYRNYDIPTEFTALNKYISDAKTDNAYTSTCCPDEEIIYGWGKHL